MNSDLQTDLGEFHARETGARVTSRKLIASKRFAYPGLTAGRLIQTLAKSEPERIAYVQSQGWAADAEPILQVVMKGAVGAISQSALPFNAAVEDALGTLRRLGAADRLPGVRRAPIGTRMVGIGTRPTGYVVGEGSGIPVTRLALTNVLLAPTKVAAIAVVSDELLRATTPGAQATLANLVLGAVSKKRDELFLLLPGAATIASTGISIAALDFDMGSALDTLDAAGSDLSQASWVIGAKLAARMSLLRGSGGAPAYPDLRSDGGYLASRPVFVTSADSSTSAGHTISLVDGAGVVLAEESQDAVQIIASQNAAVQMLDNPTVNSLAPTTATTLVSLYQTNSTALRAIWHTGWFVDPSSAVKIIGVAL